MLIQQLSTAKQGIETKEREIEVVGGDDSELSFSFGFPSLPKINQQACTKTANFSVIEISSKDPFDFETIFSEGYDDLKEKYKKFKKSTSFISKFASLAFASGQAHIAEREIQGIIHNKKSKSLTHQLADIYLHNGRLGDAESVLNKLDSSDILYNLKMAYLKLKNNQIQHAIVFLENALKNDSSDSRVQMFLGALYLSNGECEKAIRSFRIASETRKDSSSLHVNLAVSHLSLGDKKKAIQQLKKSIEINPLNENAIVFYADLLFQEKKHETCIPELEFFVKFNENSEYALERLARSYYYGNHHRKAKIVLEKLTKISQEPSVNNNMGLVVWKMGDLKKSLSYLVKSLNDSIEKCKDISVPLLNLTILLNEVKYHSKVIDVVDDLINKDNFQINEDKFSDISVQYLIALESMSKYEEASEFIDNKLKHKFNKINNAIPIIVSKLYLSTAVNSNKKEFYEFAENLKEIFDKEEIDADRRMMVINNLIFGYLYFDDIISAKKMINLIAPYINKDAFCTATFGLYKMKRGEIDKGREIYQSAISLTKKREFKGRIRQRMFLELGKIYLKSYDYKKAKECFQKAIKESGGYDYANQEGNKLLSLIAK